MLIRLGMPFAAFAALGLATVLATPDRAQAGSGAPLHAGPAIVPLTRISPEGGGYMADPQPIRRPGPNAVQFVSGTTKAVLRCPFPLRPNGCTSTPLAIDAAGLRPAVQAVGARVTNIQNVDLYQADDGRWHAAVTIGVATAAHPQHWTVIAHAHPTAPSIGDAPPAAWSADTLLSGSFDRPEAGNYDAKYYQEDGRIYLLYVANTRPQPDLRNAIVLQPMASFERPAGPPVILLETGDRYGELSSEQFGDTPAKLVEAPWLAVVGGKHALIYSTGSYLTPGYKAGVAWSDALLPPPGGRYRKVLEPDPQGIWRSAGGRDVRYLVQSARPRWPNFSGGAVIGPGVAAPVWGAGGGLWLVFNGFAPDDMPQGPNGRVDASHRRPFAVLLRQAVPQGVPVAAASDEQLAGWLTPIAR